MTDQVQEVPRFCWVSVQVSGPMRDEDSGRALQDLVGENGFTDSYLGQLEGVPQPVVVLLEVLLEKDPGRRFQSPTALLKAMTTVTDAIDSERTITQESLQKMLNANPYTVVARNTYPATQVRNCCERWVLKGLRRSYGMPATSLVSAVGIALL